MYIKFRYLRCQTLLVPKGVRIGETKAKAKLLLVKQTRLTYVCPKCQSHAISRKETNARNRVKFFFR
jgi:predicted RNA-binding Zn-ribbon protein involved in translation (DUF1610 family)